MARPVKYSIPPKELAAKLGVSTASIYKRLKRGETPEQIMGAADATPAVTDRDEIAVAALHVAEAVLWAAEHINEKITLKKAGSKIKYTYWKLGQDNPEALLVNLVPKAWTEIGKHEKPDDQAAIEEAERQDIADLLELLEGAIAEAAL